MVFRIRICGVIIMAQKTFTITSDTYSLHFNLPEYGGANKTINKNLDLINFWKGDISVIDRGIGDEPLVLGGVETLKGDNVGLCFPICFSCFCFSKPLSDKVEAVWDLQNNGEEVTITGLGDTLDGVYVIKNFEFETIKKTNMAFAWRFELELVREV